MTRKFKDALKIGICGIIILIGLLMVHKFSNGLMLIGFAIVTLGSAISLLILFKE